MGKDEFKLDLDFDLSKYNYDSGAKRSFSIDEILGTVSTETSESKEIDILKSAQKTIQKEPDFKIENSVKHDLPSEIKMMESDQELSKSSLETKNELKEKPAKVEVKSQGVSNKKNFSDQAPVVNTAVFDQIKAKSKPLSDSGEVVCEQEKGEESKKTEIISDVSHKPEVIDEYSGADEREDVIFDLQSLQNKITAKLVPMFLLLLGGLYLSFTRIEHLRFLLPTQLDPTLNPKNYLLCVSAITVIAFLMNISPLFDGLKKAFSARLTADGIALCLGITCLIYNTYFWLNAEKFIAHVITLDVIFVLMLTMNLVGKRLLVKHIAANFKMFSDERLKSIVAAPTARAIDNDVMIETGNGGDVLYAAKTKRVSDYMKKAFAEQNVNRKTDLFYFLLFALLLVSATILWLFKVLPLHNLVLLFAAFCAICSPIFSGWTRTLSVFRLGRFLRSNRTMISGREGAYQVADCGVLVVRDTDVLSNNDISLKEMNISDEIDDATVISTLAALFKKVDGPLNGFFEKLLTEDLDGAYPEICEIDYHEQLGYTFVSNDTRFSVGTNEFMRQSKIDCPFQTASEGMNVYVAVDGKVKAVFTLVYQLSKRSARALQLLESQGVSTAIITTDFCLRESLFADVLYDPDFITILSNETARSCMPISSITEDSAAEIITYNAISGLALGLVGCEKLISDYEKHGVYRITASVFGALVILVSGFFLPSLSFWLPFQILLYQMIWSIPSFLMGLKIRK